MFGNNWNKNHAVLWKIPLEINANGFSQFQSTLVSEVKFLLDSNSIKYIEEITEHIDNLGNNKIVKIVTILLTDFVDSRLWIYHDMAEYEINGTHHIYEEWGYLSPNELQEKYKKNLLSIIKIK